MVRKKNLRFLLITLLIAVILLLFADFSPTTNPIYAAPSQQLSLIESDNAVVSREGVWIHQNAASASGGSYLYSSGAVSDALVLDFVGSTIEISYVENAALGSFAIEIDNVLRRTVETSSENTSFDNRAIIDYLEAGHHTLKVYAIDGVIGIDAFYATLPPPAARSRVEAAPAAATLVSPSGAISTNPPTFTWNAVATVTYYHLVVSGPSGTTIIDQWYTAANANCPAGTGQCTASPAVTQLGGNHSWWIQTYSDTSGPWSAPLNFTQNNGMVKPVAITASAPTGDIATNMPTYTWNADPWAQWYYIWVGNGSTGVVAEWVSRESAGCPNGTGTCSATPTTRLKRGNHVWFVSGWNPLGTGPWNLPGLAFNVTVGSPLTTTMLVSPSTPITTNQPTFTWNAVTDANKYLLYVSGPSGVLLNQWMTATEVGCPSGTGTCSYTASGALLLSGGSHSWWVQVGNDWGNGAWSAGKSFTYTPIAPIQVNMITPIGAVDNVLPVYQWDADPNAEWYQILVQQGASTVVSNWYSRSQAGCGSGAGTCSVHPTSPYLVPGVSYKWYVHSYNSTGSAWTAPQNFNLTNAAGFIDLFNSASGNWTTTAGTWFTGSGNYYTNPSAPDSWSTAYYSPQTYDNFDLTARIYRNGCSWCDSGIIVRGTPTPLYSENRWNIGYGFYFDQEGFYRIVRYDGAADPVILQDWTQTAALNYGATYNIIRVIAIADTFNLYINGVFITTLVDSTHTTGNVALAMYRGDPIAEPKNVGDIWVDWITLYRFSPTP